MRHRVMASLVLVVMMGASPHSKIKGKFPQDYLRDHQAVVLCTSSRQVDAARAIQRLGFHWTRREKQKTQPPTEVFIIRWSFANDEFKSKLERLAEEEAVLVIAPQSH